MTRWNPGDLLPARVLTGLHGDVALPAAGTLVHLQLRRFAGCPICDLHLRSIVRRQQALRAAGVCEVVVFHSSAPELHAHGAHALPLAVIPDPDKRLYRELGAEAAPRALADPRAWWPIVRAVAHALWRVLRGHAPLRAPRAENGRLGLPADFLIAPDGRILARKYGRHAADQWSVDELLALAAALKPHASARGTPSPDASPPAYSPGDPAHPPGLPAQRTERP